MSFSGSDKYAQRQNRLQEIAERVHRTMIELFREALRRYMQGDKEWESLLKRTRALGQALGIASEEEVERQSDEYRRDQPATSR